MGKVMLSGNVFAIFGFLTTHFWVFDHTFLALRVIIAQGGFIIGAFLWVFDTQNAEMHHFSLGFWDPHFFWHSGSFETEFTARSLVSFQAR